MLTALMILLFLPSSDLKAPRVDVKNPFCTAPCTIEIVISKLESAPKQTEVCVVLENGKSRRACWPHSGAKQTTVLISEIPAGEYIVWGQVGGEDGPISNRINVKVDWAAGDPNAPLGSRR